jgi:hypothetical protein
MRPRARRLRRAGVLSGARQFGLRDSPHVLLLFYKISSFTRNEGMPKYVPQVLSKYGSV